ncbi:MAG TPA: alpha-L-fucosidase [Bacteroidales bacterium]|nr:alpha-L-fucosidase [Bacteroidales bacterium]
MKRTFLTIFLLISIQLVEAQVIVPSDKPNVTQKLQLKRGYGMFMHFGVNTFAGVEWSDGSLPATMYHPTALDCDQWVKVARDAGFRYVILTTKHHDGFCLWDSQFTTYDVASSPVKTDVVAAVAKACKKYDIGFALYYSLWDRHEPSYKSKDFSNYVDYMINQLTELFTNYGPICELWFDGSWDRPVKDWELDRVYRAVKKLQPNCAIGTNLTIVQKEGENNLVIPDLMTVDNKYVVQYFPTDFRLWDPNIAHLKDKKQYMHQGESYYLPFEHTICLSKEWTWFQKPNPGPTRDLDELEQLFNWTTSNNNVLVVNVPPDTTGQLTEQDANAVILLGKRLGIKKNRPLPKNDRIISLSAEANATSVWENNISDWGAKMAVDGGMRTRWASSEIKSELVVKLNPNESFNKIAIFEYQDVQKSNDPTDIFSTYRVNRIQSYTIDILVKDQWKTIYSDNRTMGDCKVIRFPGIYKTSEIRLRILKATAPPSIYEFNVIHTK